MKCLLCHSEELKISENINRKNIIKIWESINIDVSEELKTKSIIKYKCENCNLFFFDPINAGQDKFYSSIGKSDWYYQHSGKTEYEIASNYIYDYAKVLDIGSGRGELYANVSKFKKFDYTGIELSTKAVEQAKEYNINVIKEDLEVHAINHIEEYDVICLFQVLEHLTEVLLFIANVKLCLKRNGTFLIAVPNNKSYLEFTSNNILNLPPHHTILWDKLTLQKLGKQFDFELIEIIEENIQEIHLETKNHAYIVKKIYDYFGFKYRSIRVDKLFYIISKVATFLLKFPFIKNLVDTKCTLGHSIIFVFKKK
jgi:2-polyprenyl-3-methyl-5-hydroxy-6-metoxy-1,4-benzoquinol methylase